MLKFGNKIVPGELKEEKSGYILEVVSIRLPDELDIEGEANKGIKDYS